MEAILKLYQQPYNPKRPLVCFDEKSVQLLAHIAQVLGMKAGQAARQDYEYKRNGTRNLLVCRAQSGPTVRVAHPAATEGAVCPVHALSGRCSLSGGCLY